MCSDRHGRRYWREFHRRGFVFVSDRCRGGKAVWTVDVNGDERFMFFIPPLFRWVHNPPNTFQTSNMNHVWAHQINFLVQAGLLSQHLISSSSLHLLLRLFLLFCFGFFLSWLFFYVLSKIKNGEKEIELNLRHCCFHTREEWLDYGRGSCS